MGERSLCVPETLSIVLSIFGLIGLGYVAARTGFLSPSVREGLSDFVFTLAVPILLFKTLATADLHGVAPWRIWIAYFAPFAAVWALSHFMIRRFFGRDGRAGIVGGGSAAYGNVVLIGVPLMEATFGQSGMVFIIVVISVHMPLMMIASLLLHEWTLRGEGGDASDVGGAGFRRLALSVILNPILIAIALGAAWRTIGLGMPQVLAAIVDPLARSAGPLALFASGMALVDYGIARQVRAAAAISTLKLILMPAAVLLAARAVGLPPLGVAALTLTAACPTGVNAFLIASRMRTGEALASNTLIISTAMGVVTVTLWLVALKGML